MKLYRYFKSYFTLQYQYDAFTDVVSGKRVAIYSDCYGDLWMKDGRWSLFRVLKKNVYA